MIDGIIARIKERSPELIKLEDTHGQFGKRLGRVIAIPMAKKINDWLPWVTPNMITFLNVLITFVIAALFATNHTLSAGILFMINLQIDWTDGSLARLKGLCSKFGAWFDHTTDDFAKVIIYLGIMIGLLKNNPASTVFLLGFLSLSAYFYGSLLYLTFFKIFPNANEIIENEKAKRSWLKEFFFIDPFITWAISFFAIINQMLPYLFISAVYGWAYCFGAWIMMAGKTYGVSE